MHAMNNEQSGTLFSVKQNNHPYFTTLPLSYSIGFVEHCLQLVERGTSASGSAPSSLPHTFLIDAIWSLSRFLTSLAFLEQGRLRLIRSHPSFKMCQFSTDRIRKREQ
uniref:Uncharacterized protein n=1 Tax=Anguilla anguilla TaxID=7936 RepID=A0A0E9V630_ANGAN